MKDTDIFSFIGRVDLPNQKSQRSFSVKWGDLSEDDKRILREHDELMDRLGKYAKQSG